MCFTKIKVHSFNKHIFSARNKKDIVEKQVATADNIIDFLDLISKACKTNRRGFNTDGAGNPSKEFYFHEDLGSHMYKVSMISLFLIKKYNFTLDPFLCMKYAMIHDIPECYTNDVIPSDCVDPDDKIELENVVFNKIFGDKSELSKLFSDFQSWKTNESKLVHFIDKIDFYHEIKRLHGQYGGDDLKSVLEVIDKSMYKNFSNIVFEDINLYEEIYIKIKNNNLSFIDFINEN